LHDIQDHPTWKNLLSTRSTVKYSFFTIVLLVVAFGKQHLPDVLLVDVSYRRLMVSKSPAGPYPKLPHMKIIALTLFDDEETRAAASWCLLLHSKG
jgi:hypothetical protein